MVETKEPAVILYIILSPIPMNPELSSKPSKLTNKTISKIGDITTNKKFITHYELPTQPK